MTIPNRKLASLPVMHLNAPVSNRNRILIAAVCLLLPAVTARAEEPALRDLLRDGLFAEEVTRDPEAAAKQYELVLSRYSEQRDFAASALFRLAEVRRKQDRKEDAVKLYQQLLAEFPAAANETRLARENLVALGGKPPEAKSEMIDEEEKELLRLQQLAKSSPDLLRKIETFIPALEKGWARPVAFILDSASSKTFESLAMVNAAGKGNLSMLKMLLSRGIDPTGEGAIGALCRAVEEGNREIVKVLLDAGTSPDGKLAGATPQYSTPLGIAARRNDVELAHLLIEKGADVNLMPSRCAPQLATSSGLYIGGPLHEAIWFDRPKIIELLLQHHADVNLMEPRSRITPVWLVTRGIKSNPVLLRRLLDLGADPDVASASKPDPRVETWPGYPGKVTPLELAIDNGSVECIKLLLEAKKSRKTSLNPTILYKAPNNFEITKMLLDHGADPNPPALESKSLIEFLVSRVVDHFLPDSENGNWHPDKIWPVIELLLERGSKVSPEWENRDFQGCHEGIRALLIRRVSYPKWAGEKVVRICHFHPNSHRFSKLNLAVQGGEETTPALGRLLLDQEKGTIGYLEKDFTTLVLMRKLNGEVKEQAFINLIGGEPFPKLEWGDILEIRDTRNGWSGGGNPWPWPQATREALERSVKTSSEPAQE